jgi:5-methylcytosine-specific restriction endonuclease McrA
MSDEQLPYHVVYYRRRKNDPAYMERKRQERKLYYQRHKDDPGFMPKQRETGRRRYHEKVKPNKSETLREQLRKNTRSYRERKLDVKLKLQQELGGQCVKCGITDYRLLDFDHIDPMTKKMNISTKLHLPWEVLLVEIKKCQLLCPNCHRLKTLEQKEYNSYVRKNRKYRNENRTVFSLPDAVH